MKKFDSLWGLGGRDYLSAMCKWMGIWIGLLPLQLMAQTLVWSEDFTGYPPGAMSAPGKWMATGTDCDDPGLNMGNQFGVFNGRFVVNDVEGAPCCQPVGGGNDNRFETEPIDISAYCSVTLSLLTIASADLECLSPDTPVFGCTGSTAIDDFHDQMLIEAVVDGAVAASYYICGSVGAGPVALPGLSGSLLVVRIFAANKFGAETYAFDDIRVTAPALPPAPLEVSGGARCPDDPPVRLSPLQFDAPGVWSGPGVAVDSFRPLLAGVGTHVLTFTPDHEACLGPSSATISVRPRPEAFSLALAPCIDPATGVARLDLGASDAQVSPGNTVVYFEGGAPVPDPERFQTADAVILTALATDVWGCLSDPVSVRVAPIDCGLPAVIYVPNTFNPSRLDGLNDRFMAYAAPGSAIIRRLSVFDRWGAEVFRQEDAAPGDYLRGWDGTHRGRALPTGVYAYLLWWEAPDGRKGAISGSVTLVRD